MALLTVCVLFLIPGCPKKQGEQMAQATAGAAAPQPTPEQTRQTQPASKQIADPNPPGRAAAKQTPKEQTRQTPTPVINKPTLGMIAARAQTWRPAFTDWYGRQAPDFSAADINGKQYTLSGYKGTNVMLVFWATWCGPCIYEMPHLIRLRSELGEDKLAMLGLSYITTFPPNSVEKIKAFVADNKKINYPIVPVAQQNLPAPFSQVNGIPCSFYIDPAGKIKFVTEGLISVPEIKAILDAEK